MNKKADDFTVKSQNSKQRNGFHSVIFLPPEGIKLNTPLPCLPPFDFLNPSVRQ